MAGDWIKMRIHLDTSPKVIQLATALDLPVLHVVGMLWKIWAWADVHSLDGNALSVTDVTLDRFVDRAGFAVALRNVGWLAGRDNALTFPRFAEHNGQTAKQRAETQARVARHRNGKGVTPVTHKPLPEKRREEEIRNHSPPTPSVPAEWSLPPPPAGGGGLMELIRKARSLGCKAAGKIMPISAKRVDLEHLRAIVDHFEAQAAKHGWSGSDLYFRLEAATLDLAPSAGWDAVTNSAEDRDAGYRSLEASHGKVLNKLTAEAFLSLAQEVLTETGPLSILRNFGVDARTERAVREPLLRHLAGQK